MDSKVVFTRRQKRILWACIIVYTAAYLNRLNLSAVLDSLMERLNITSAQAGLLQTAFAVVYAAGQFVNGAIVDRVDPVRHMLTGIVCSGVCGLLMGVIGLYPVMLILCMLNGAFQSMLWTPIVRLIAMHFHTKKARERANIEETLTMVFGHLGAWAISGFMASRVGWRFSFIVPALLVAPIAAVAAVMLRGAGQAERPAGEKPAEEDRRGRAAMPLRPLFLATGFLLMLVSCVFYGFVKDGIVTWAPTIIGSFSAESLSATAFSLIIPVVETVGIVAGFVLQQKSGQNNRRLIALILLAAAAFCAPLRFAGGMLPAALLMGGACACVYGLNPILTALVPLEYDRAGRISLTAGLVDSFIYVGSALAGVAAGAIYNDGAGAHTLYLAWTLAAAAGFVAAWLAGSKRALDRIGGGVK